LQDAQRELAKLLVSVDAGTLVEPSHTTVAEYIRAWLDGTHGLSAKTTERYRELAERQIIPHLGSVLLQKLRPKQVQTWHANLLKADEATGRVLSARTVGHAHRVLHRVLAHAMAAEEVSRNVAGAVRPPKVTAKEIEILTAEQVTIVLERMQGHPLYSIAALALATGMRRGELLALQLRDVDLDAASLRVERSLEETADARYRCQRTPWPSCGPIGVSSSNAGPRWASGSPGPRR
jgi:integrase